MNPNQIAEKNNDAVNKEAILGSIEIKNYTLNELKAIKKKWKNIDNVPMQLIGDSHGGSINVDMKTSLFEVVRNKLIEDLKMKKDTIEKVALENTSKAITKNNSKADVEYTLDVVFKTNGIQNEVKIKIYTTSCRF